MFLARPYCKLLVTFRYLKSSYLPQVLGSGFYFKGLQVSDGIMPYENQIPFI